MVCGNGGKPSEGPEVASMGVTFAGIASVSEYNLWSPTTNAQEDPPMSGMETIVYPRTLTVLPSGNPLSCVYTASGAGVCLAESRGHSIRSDLCSGARVIISTQVQHGNSVGVSTGVTGREVAGIGASVGGSAWNGGGMGCNYVSGIMGPYQHSCQH